MMKENISVILIYIVANFESNRRKKNVFKISNMNQIFVPFLRLGFDFNLLWMDLIRFLLKTKFSCPNIVYANNIILV